MKKIQYLPIGFLISFLFINTASGAPIPSWSVNVKFGEFQPSSATYALEYGPSSFQGALEIGYYLIPQIEVGVGTGYLSGNASVYSTSGRQSALKQQLILIPTQLFLTYQFEFKNNQLLVPYFGGGFTHVTYRHSIDEQDTASGGVEGYHARAGMKLLLNRFEPNRAKRLYENWGIIHTYFLIEGQYSHVNGFGDSSINLGGWSYFGGLLLDF